MKSARIAQSTARWGEEDKRMIYDRGSPEFRDARWTRVASQVRENFQRASAALSGD